ncbi:MAG: glycosyltransferase family 4 protein [Actinomycetota bacterium]
MSAADDLERALRRVSAAGIRRVESFAWRDLDDPEAGGSELHADEIFTRWAATGLVEIEHRTSTSDAPRTLERHGYRVEQRGGRFDVFARVIAAQTLRRALRQRRADVATIEIWNGVPWLSPWWSPQRSIVWLHHVHREMWADVLREPLATLGRWNETKVAPRAYQRALVNTLSDSSKSEIVGIGVPAAHIDVIPPGVDERYAPDESQRSPDPSVLIVGRLAPVKRQQVALTALHRARERHPRLTVEVIGDGPDRPRLEQWVADQEAEWVTLRGRVSDDELLAAYQRAWLVVSASYAEGWGMSLTEGGACATPCVATDIAGHRGAAIDGTTGTLVADPGDIGDAVVALLTDDARRYRYAAAAREHAAGLSWTAVAARQAHRLADACQPRPR